MNTMGILLVFLSMPFLAQPVPDRNAEIELSLEQMNLIRNEKFIEVLPQAMQDNKVDMWIHVIRGEDLLNFEFGYESGVYIFTDRGGNRIERAMFGGRVNRELYEFSGPESDIPAFVAERDPKRIALNYSDERPRMNTISEEDRTKLLNALGEKYSKRVVPAARLIADYLAGRTMPEIALYSRLLMISTGVIEEEFRKIVPGKTTLKEIRGNVFLRDPDGNEENNTDYVVQRGDLIGILDGANAKSFSEHNGSIGYVLREGETELPQEVKDIWNHALITRDIFRKNIKAGSTGEEIFKVLVEKIEEAGYIVVYDDQYDKTADPEKTQIFIDFHGLGRIISQEDSPRISSTGWGRHLKIPLYHTFTFEYMLHMPVPKWGKCKHLYICIHDGVMVTERGVEFPAPPIREIQIIR